MIETLVVSCFPAMRVFLAACAESAGIYPNAVGEGIGQGHLYALAVMWSRRPDASCLAFFECIFRLFVGATPLCQVESPPALLKTQVSLCFDRAATSQLRKI